MMPTRKVGAGILAGSITTLILYLLKVMDWPPMTGYEGAALSSVLTFIVSYWTTEP